MIALADHDLVRLCRDPRYAERFPRSPAERRSRARKIGITLRRPVNATPLVTVWRLIAEAGLAPLRAPAPRPERARARTEWRRPLSNERRRFRPVLVFVHRSSQRPDVLARRRCSLQAIAKAEALTGERGAAGQSAHAVP